MVAKSQGYDDYDDHADNEKTQKRVRQPVSREAIERLLQFRQQLIKETNGTVFDDTAEILHQERERRTMSLLSLKH
ncbi:MAG: hypothetical protein ACYDER_22125 [Ktedonobacteraceae bacterium]